MKIGPFDITWTPRLCIGGPLDGRVVEVGGGNSVTLPVDGGGSATYHMHSVCTRNIVTGDDSYWYVLVHDGVPASHVLGICSKAAADAMDRALNPPRPTPLPPA